MPLTKGEWDMDYTRSLDYIPLWVIFLATMTAVVGAVEVGHRFGERRRRRADQEKDGPVAAIVAAMLGLLAFMLAFTFGAAAARFDARKMAVLEESNAIGTAYLRAGMLPDPHAAESRKIFREYIDVRLEAVKGDAVTESIAKSSTLQNSLWSHASAAAASDSRSIPTGLYIEALNDVIDVHSKRVLLALHNRVPSVVWLCLYVISLLGMATLGYQQGLSGSRRSLAVLALALSFSAVILLVADLDRPAKGILKVSQQSMIDLRDSLDAIDAAVLPAEMSQQP